MKAYKQLVQHVLDNGQRYETNKGVCIGVIGTSVSYDISQGIPIVTGKKTNVKWAIAEYAMFLKGISNVDFLRPYGAEKIWESQGLSEDFVVERHRQPLAVAEDFAAAMGMDVPEAEQFLRTRTAEYARLRQELDASPPMMDNPNAEQLEEQPGVEGNPPVQVVNLEAYQEEAKKLEAFLVEPFVKQNISLTEKVVVRPKGDLGPIYGTQWRAWLGVDPKGRKIKIDQLADVVTKLRENPESRQIIMTSWNPAFIVQEKFSYDEKIKAGFMGQPPCHVDYHFLTRKNEAGEYVLNLTVFVRSNDLMLGHPFNALGGGLVAHLVAKTLGFKTGTLNMLISDAHVYENHLENVGKYLESEIFEQPSFNLPEHVDVFNFEVQDILNALGEYKHGPYIPFPLNTNDNALKEQQASNTPYVRELGRDLTEDRRGKF